MSEQNDSKEYYRTLRNHIMKYQKHCGKRRITSLLARCIVQINKKETPTVPSSITIISIPRTAAEIDTLKNGGMVVDDFNGVSTVVRHFETQMRFIDWCNTNK